MKLYFFTLLSLLPFTVCGQQATETDSNKQKTEGYVVKDHSAAVFAIKLSYDPLGGYYILPDDLLNGRYEYAFGWFPLEKKGNVISFFWDSWMIDGRYYLRFSPKQMVLYSSHDNPNPDYIYWVSDITEEQFQALKKIPQFEYDWLSEDEKTEDSLAYKNLKRLLRQINRHMGNLKFTIPTKKEFNSVQRVLLNPDLG